MKRVPIRFVMAVLGALLVPAAVPIPTAGSAPSTPPAAIVATQVPPPYPMTLTAYDLGTLAYPSNVRGRDEGVSALVGGRSLWAFGDTFSASSPIRDRTSTGALNVQGFLPTTEPLDGTGYPSAALLSLTSAEQQHHQNHPNQRPWVWPNGIIPREGTTSLIWWNAAIDDGTGQLRAVPGTSRAGIADVAVGATTATRRPALFGGEDCQWGSPVLDTDGEYVYVYATADEANPSDQRTSCPDRFLSAYNTMVGRVKLSEAGTRSAYRFWNGTTWVTDQLSAVTVHSLTSANVVWDEANGVYVAIGGFDDKSYYSTAPSPHGPWSRLPSGDHALYITPIPPETNGFGNYAWRFHREHAGAGGAVQLVSYARERAEPFLGGAIQLLAVDSRPNAATERREYIARTYQTFLGFAPSSSDITYWANRLANRSLTVPEFTRQLALSLDGRKATVRRAYTEALGRTASASDMTYWAGELTKPGWGHDVLTAKLAASAESRNRYATNAEYVDAMYQLAFGRSADSSGLNYWVSQLQPAGSLSDYAFVLQLMQSHEGGQRQAALAYDAILGRSATAIQKSGVASVTREATKIRMAVASTAEAIGVD